MLSLFTKGRIYLDYAAATPVRKEVLKAMTPYWSEKFGNPGAVHKEGVEAKKAVESAREKVAKTLRITPSDVLFTSGGTESNNLAIKGSVEAMVASGVAIEDIEIISTSIEHPSVKNTLESLEKEGCVVTCVPVDEEGRIILEEFKNSLSPRTRLVTVAYANSETGVVQDVAKLARQVRAYERENGLTILLHTDAAQAPLWLSVALDSLGVDMLSLDAGKCEGPKGVGVLALRPRVQLAAVTHGGSQERSYRPGTEPVPLVVGCAEAIYLAQLSYKERGGAAAALRDRWLKKLKKVKGVIVNGSTEYRLPNNINISIPGFDSEFAVVDLDNAGISASTKSACSGADSGLSYVVYEMSGDSDRASSTIRFSLNSNVKYGQLKKVTKVLKKHLSKMREFKTK